MSPASPANNEVILNPKEDVTKRPRLMVYGTLRKGYHNYEHYLKRADYLGDYQDLLGLMFHAGGFPAIALIEPRTPIFGEVYSLTWEELRAIDGLERHPTWYLRSLVQMGNYGPVWTYVWPKEIVDNWQRRMVIPSGKWEGHNTQQRHWLGWGRGWVGSEAPKPSTDPKERFPVVTRVERDGKYYVQLPDGTERGPYNCLNKFPIVGEAAALADPKVTPIGEAVRCHLRPQVKTPEEEKDEYQGFGPGAESAEPRKRTDKGGVSP